MRGRVDDLDDQAAKLKQKTSALGDALAGIDPLRSGCGVGGLARGEGPVSGDLDLARAIEIESCVEERSAGGGKRLTSAQTDTHNTVAPVRAGVSGCDALRQQLPGAGVA